MGKKIKVHELLLDLNYWNNGSKDTKASPIKINPKKNIWGNSIGSVKKKEMDCNKIYNAIIVNSKYSKSIILKNDLDEVVQYHDLNLFNLNIGEIRNKILNDILNGN
jgi:hypothetical protein